MYEKLLKEIDSEELSYEDLMHKKLLKEIQSEIPDSMEYKEEL